MSTQGVEANRSEGSNSTSEELPDQSICNEIVNSSMHTMMAVRIILTSRSSTQTIMMRHAIRENSIVWTGTPPPRKCPRIRSALLHPRRTCWAGRPSRTFRSLVCDFYDMNMLLRGAQLTVSPDSDRCSSSAYPASTSSLERFRLRGTKTCLVVRLGD